MRTASDLHERISRVRLVLMDCDGVLTDGRLLLGSGVEQKAFHVRDGQGLVLLHRAGLISGIISGRSSGVVEQRARELGVRYLKQGDLNKVKGYDEILAQARVEAESVAFVGDDVTDIPVMRRSGFAVAVKGAGEETRSAAHYVTQLPGGFGAVREVIELILKTQRLWSDLMQAYTQG